MLFEMVLQKEISLLCRFSFPLEPYHVIASGKIRGL